MKKIALVWLAMAGVAMGARPDQTLQSGLDVSSFDQSVRPQDDLFRYVNGSWLAATDVSGDRVSRTSFTEIADKTESDLRSLIEGLIAGGKRGRGTIAQQIGDLYTSMVDESRVDTLGAAPIAPELAKIDAIATPRAFAAEVGYLSSIAAGGPFAGVVETDERDPRAFLVRVSQGGTLLPNRDYYLADDPKFVTAREGYRAYLARVYTLVGRANPSEDANAVLALETELAKAQWTPVDSRNPVKTANTYELSRLATEMPGFDWPAWAAPQGLNRTPRIILVQPSFFRRFAELAQTTPLSTWKPWLVARFVTAMSNYLSAPFVNARFDFFGTVLTGQELPRARWKRGVGMVNQYLGDAVGELYVKKYFPASARTRVEKLAGNLVKAIKQSIVAVTWMSSSAKAAALDKLTNLTLEVGYPDTWRGYDGLDIRADDLVGNVQRAQKFDNEYRMARMAAPAGRREWLMTPQTTNAYYNPSRNTIAMPAAMLQPPLFTVEADDAVNYGAIGSVIGHEIGHGFDAGGRWMDGHGVARDWWTAADERAFQPIMSGVFEQFSTYVSLDGMHVNGELTLAENLGDLGGLSLAYQAYKLSLGGKPAPVIDGLTGDQRFFLGWARMWRAKMRPEYLRQWLLTIPYAPPEFRANGPVSHLSSFYDAFGVKPGDALYREPGARIRIW